ncbi:MAG: hypothetical protein GY841_11785 [FCB group bacterium]|nr:hypothetical protein [FCB group bacterium]
MSKVLFCDWEADTGDFDSNTLLEVSNLNQYDVLFFDPHGFTLNNGFRESRSDLRLADYKSYSEVQFLAYLSKVKALTEQLHKFLDSGGIWVIRSILPNSSIKIRKKSNAGQRRYTESIISFFFWLEEFIGTYSFQYSLGNVIKFNIQQNPIALAFRDIPVEYVQTQDRISRGTVEIMAGTQGPMSLPVLTRISYGQNQGEIYFIPKFLTVDEHARLAKTFSAIAWEKEFGPYKPNWILEYEDRLTTVNPYVSELNQLDRQIKKLSETRTVVDQECEKVQSVTGLLFHTGDNLVELVKVAMIQLGFSFPNPPVAVIKSGFDFYARDEQARQIVGLAVSSENDPVPFEDFDRLREEISGCQLMDKPKGIIIANTACALPPEERSHWFADDMIEQAEAAECCLLSTYELFRLVCYILSKADSAQMDAVKHSLQKEIIECCGIFRLNEKKYILPV